MAPNNARRDFARQRESDDDRDVITLGEWTYAGTGHTGLPTLEGRTA